MLNSFDYSSFLEELKSYKEEEFRLFSLKTIHTNYEMLGVRTKYMEHLSKKIKNIDIDYFYNLVTFTYYEEVMILGFVIARLKDNKKRIIYFNKFIEKVDNWAICDSVINRFKLKDNELDFYFPYIKELASKKHEFTCRSSYVFLLTYYMEDKYLDDIFTLIKSNKNDTYYVKIAISWLLSYTYFIDKTKTLEFIKEKVTDKFIYHKSISKIRESLRISKEEKEYLKLLLTKKE